MTPRGFFVLLVVTVALVAAAVYTYPGGPSAGPTAGAKFFPNLGPEALNRVASVTVTSGGKSFTVYKKADKWFVKELGDYPAVFDNVKTALVALSELTPYEAKTSDKDQLDKLNLEDPSKKGASSKRITLKDKDGKTIADMVIGKSNDNPMVYGQEMVYVRRPSETQAWLASGDPKVQDKMLDWASKDVINISGERIKELTIKHADGETIELAKAKPAGKEFELKNLPDGREVKDKQILGYIAEVFENNKMENVQPAAKLDMAKAKPTVVTMTTFDGVSVTATLVKEKDTNWVTFKASFDPAAALKEKPAKDSALKSAEDAKNQVEAINARLGKWAYEIGSTNARYMQFKLKDVLKEEKKDDKKDG